MRTGSGVAALCKVAEGTVPHLHRDVRGFSLVEQLVALAVMSTGIILLLAGLTTAGRGIKLFADQVTSQSLARSQLELIKDHAYIADPTVSPYPSVSPPAPYTIGTTVEYWNASTETFVATVRNDGMQRITVAVFKSGAQVLTVSDYKVDR